MKQVFYYNFWQYIPRKNVFDWSFTITRYFPAIIFSIIIGHQNTCLFVTRGTVVTKKKELFFHLNMVLPSLGSLPYTIKLSSILLESSFQFITLIIPFAHTVLYRFHQIHFFPTASVCQSKSVSYWILR